MKSIIVALADKNFINQAKQLFSTVYWNSGWSGDYALLAYDIPEYDLSWFAEKGIIITRCKPLDIKSDKIGDKITACKIYLFSDLFLKWDNVVYIDVDILTRGSIKYLSYVNDFSACYSLGQTLGDNFMNLTEIPSVILDGLNTKYDFSKRAFNSGVMAFPTSIITKTMFEELLQTFNKYVKYGLFGGDQLPFNIYFYNKWHELPQAFNQITPLNNKEYDINKLQGLIIHCVSFGNGPWSQQSIFYDEWYSNFTKADMIDLNNIPNITPLNYKQIERKSKSVFKTYLTGGTLSADLFFKRISQACKVAIVNPVKFFRKIKELSR